MSEYNGWANYETWNVALWIGNDEPLYNMALRSRSYPDLVEQLKEFNSLQTPDGVAWNNSALDVPALDEMIGEL